MDNTTGEKKCLEILDLAMGTVIRRGWPRVLEFDDIVKKIVRFKTVYAMYNIKTSLQNHIVTDDAQVFEVGESEVFHNMKKLTDQEVV